ncbi:MAG: asparagine synthase (glutamine-hydrolyzing) [bacterium]
MCGIAGIIDRKTDERDRTLTFMVQAIIHRGPDDDGFYSDGRVSLGMRRLSIIDPAGGKQPISSKDGNLIIFFNGEIYNYKELKKELEQKGHKFKTNSDTEVVLQMYEVYGKDFLPKLRGMFAFAIYNKMSGEIFIARDFFGIKPLYYLKKNNTFAFSSEFKSFLSMPGLKREVNDEAVYNFLFYQYNPLDETFLKGVHKLPQGHYMTVSNDGRYEITKYWEFKFEQNEKLIEEETRKKILDTMEDSVAHHMIADVPVGSFLSGGIDSSIIATLMQRVRNGELESRKESPRTPESVARLSSFDSSSPINRVKTFTVGFDHVSERNEARETSDPLGTEHREISVSADEYFKALPNAVWHFDEPVADPSAIGIYFLAREARKHVKVVLSGEGADELFGGYNIYLEPFARRRARFIPRFVLRLISKLPFRGKNFAERMLVRLEDRYIGNAKVFRDEEVAKLWKGEKQNKFDLSELYNKARKLSDSSKMQYIDVHTWLIGDILSKADKMTMAHSLELRVPFLDKEVADLARTLPDKFKWRNSQTKYLLREAFRNILPESTRKRPKLGFPTAIRDWLKEDRYKVFDLIRSNSYTQSHFDMAEIEKLIMDHLSGKRDNSRKLYLFIMLALWYNIFINNGSH